MALQLLNLPFSGPDGSTAIVDSTGNSRWRVASSGNTQIQSNALLCDGEGDYVWTADTGTFQFGPWDFSIKLDVKTILSRDQCLVDFWTGVSTPGWQFCLTGGRLGWWASGLMVRLYIGTATINDGNFHTVEVRRVNGVLYFYIDDVLDGSVADTRDYNYSPTYMGVGGQIAVRTPSVDFGGSLRNVVITRPDLEDARQFTQPKKHAIPNDIATQFEQYRKHPVWTPVFFAGFKIFDQFKRTRGVPPWWGPNGATTQLPTYKIRGRVMQRDPDGVLPDWPLANVRVALFYRRLNTLLDVKLSDENGYVQFDNLMPGNGAYYGIAFDNEGSPLQNSIIWDRLSSEPGP